MVMNNPFNNPAFNLAALTVGINKLPNLYGLINKLGVFPDRGVPVRTVMVEEYQGILNLLPSKPVGSPGTAGRQGRRTLRSFVIPHIPHDDVILPEDAQGIRAFGTETGFESLAGVMARRLGTARRKHDITLEWLRIGALQGLITDGDGVTTLYNLFTEFGIAQQVFNFNFSNAAFDVKGQCLAVKRFLDDNLLGETADGVQALVSEQFFDAFSNHPQVIEAYKWWQSSDFLRSDYRGGQTMLGTTQVANGFSFGGVNWQEYRGKATLGDGTVKKFIADNTGLGYPTGTTDSFATYYAPADFNETVNTIGLPVYAKQKPRDYDRGTDLHTQSNPLPLCHRPALLVKFTMS